MINHFDSSMAIETPSKLKKAYCKYCKTDDELSRIFSVNPEAEICYCPNCMVELKPKEAIDEYNYFILQKTTKADRLLYRDTRFYDAYCAYARIIEIDPSIMHARFGRILSLLYMSTLRHTHFVDSMTLLEREAEQYFRKMKDQNHYAKFLSKALNAIDEYQNRFVKRITFKERFYSLDCAELYFTRLYEIIEAKKFIIGELSNLVVKNPDEKIVRLISSSNIEIAELQRQFDKNVTTTDGNKYKVAKVISPYQILINRLDEQVTPFVRHKHYKLNENEKKGRLIKDDVYPDNSHLMMLITGIIPFITIFFSATIAAVLFYVFKWLDLGLIPLFIAGGSFIIYIITLVLFIKWKHQLSKRRHLID